MYLTCNYVGTVPGPKLGAVPEVHCQQQVLIHAVHSDVRGMPSVATWDSCWYTRVQEIFLATRSG